MQCTFSQLEIVVARKVLVRKVAAATYRKSLLKLQLLKRILNPFITGVVYYSVCPNSKSETVNKVRLV